MKTFNNYILPSVGKIFKINNILTFKADPSSNYEEIDIDINNIKINGDYVYIDNKFFVKLNSDRPIKAQMITKLFSIDDQIAIILNKDKEMMTFMNEWRSWFSNLINNIKGME